MIKWLLKLMLPAAEDLSTVFADTCAKAINESGKSDQIALYSSYVEKWDKVQQKIVQWLSDGKIDDAEKKEMAKAIEPLIQQLLAEIKK